ncbi:MAG: multiheme c-type cytochrome [Candidatus Binatia bacterium]
MSRLIYSAIVILVVWIYPRGAVGQPQSETCAVCHLAMGVEKLTKPAEDYKSDIHAAKGFGCVACHGGDGTIGGLESMDRKKGYIGKPTRAQVVEVCGRCHADANFMRRYNPSLRVDQVAEYYTSVHGRRLREQKDENVATCANCHVAHSIRPANDARSTVHPTRVAETCGGCHANKDYMARYKIPTDQVEKYKKSVHWKLMTTKGDLSAPTCNDCHGNHGAAPPGISSVVNVCGQCHPVNTELFNKSPHSKIFVQMGIPGCAACHSNHEIAETSDAMLSAGDKSACTTCHPPASSGATLAASMLASIDRLKTGYERAQVVLKNAEHAGMEVSQPLFELSEAKTSLIKARAAIHGFDQALLDKEVEPGLKVSARAHARGVKALDELQFRRKGLAISTLIIFALVIGLIIKIRQMEKQPK